MPCPAALVSRLKPCTCPAGARLGWKQLAEAGVLREERFCQGSRMGKKEAAAGARKAHCSHPFAGRMAVGHLCAM